MFPIPRRRPTRLVGDGVGVVISTGGFRNAITLLSPRVYQALARVVSRVVCAVASPVADPPVVAILFQGLVGGAGI